MDQKSDFLFLNSGRKKGRNIKFSHLIYGKNLKNNSNSRVIIPVNLMKFCEIDLQSLYLIKH